MIADRSHMPAWSAPARPACLLRRMVTFSTRRPDRPRASAYSSSGTPNGSQVSALIGSCSVQLSREIRGGRQGLVKELVKQLAEAHIPQDGSQAQAPVDVLADPGSDAGGESRRRQ